MHQRIGQIKQNYPSIPKYYDIKLVIEEQTGSKAKRKEAPNLIPSLL
ncbi:MAG: hypothetical protein SNJ71_05990 [Bacteroidales bacterium]